MALRLFDDPDVIDPDDISYTTNLLDTYIDRVCTKATRPSTAWVGLRVWETDTAAGIVCVSVGPIVWRYFTIPAVANAAGRNALSPVHTGMTCTRVDKGWTEVYDGTAWRTVGTVAVTAGTDVTHPYTDQLVILLADHLLYRWDGAAWILHDDTRAELIGGVRYNSNAAAIATGIAATEALTNMNTGTLSLPANSVFEIRAQVAWNAVTATVGPDFYIRDTNLAGTVRYEAVPNGALAAAIGIPYQTLLVATYRTTIAESKSFVVTAKRISGTGTISVFRDVNGAAFITVHRIGKSSRLTDA
jgi:hypothetical protein